MKWNVMLVAVALTALMSGCVWTSEYKSKLSEIDGLQNNISSLEVKLKKAEAELSDLKKKNDELAKEKAGLVEENKNIKSTLESKRNQLMNEVVDLKNQLSETRGRIKALEDELSARNKQIADLKAQSEQLSQEKAKAVEDKERALAQTKNTYDSLVKELKQEIKQGEVQITQLRDKLTVNMVEKILFDSGSAMIKKNGKKVLDRVADILKNVTGQQIKVEGHTDNVPIGPGLADKFPTNWELSTARATTVVRYLQEKGVGPKYLSAEGYSEFRPVEPNETDEGKAKNRRIEIVLIPLDVNR